MDVTEDDERNWLHHFVIVNVGHTTKNTFTFIGWSILFYNVLGGKMYKIAEQVKIMNDMNYESSNAGKLNAYREIGKMFGNLDTSTSKTIVVGVTNIMKHLKKEIEKLDKEVKFK
jgi:hypothetical protein|tara:strand:- start:961 stop:1305 length:345 start_codon:yes stop_codon:yes gene_type:complete